MTRIMWLLVIFCCLFTVPAAVADHAEQIVVVPSSEVRFFNVRLYQSTDSDWLLRGRLTRADKDTKVPAGLVVVNVFDAQGKQVYTRSGHYKPGFVHRKTKRASYFTLRIPAQIILDNPIVQLVYRPQSP